MIIISEMAGDIQALSTYLSDRTHTTKVVVTSNSTQNKDLGATKLTHFELPADLANGRL